MIPERNSPQAEIQESVAIFVKGRLQHLLVCQ